MHLDNKSRVFLVVGCRNRFARNAAPRTHRLRGTAPGHGGGCLAVHGYRRRCPPGLQDGGVPTGNEQFASLQRCSRWRCCLCCTTFLRNLTVHYLPQAWKGDWLTDGAMGQITQSSNKERPFEVDGDTFVSSLQILERREREQLSLLGGAHTDRAPSHD